MYFMQRRTLTGRTCNARRSDADRDGRDDTAAGEHHARGIDGHALSGRGAGDRAQRVPAHRNAAGCSGAAGIEFKRAPVCVHRHAIRRPGAVEGAKLGPLEDARADLTRRQRVKGRTHPGGAEGDAEGCGWAGDAHGAGAQHRAGLGVLRVLGVKRHLLPDAVDRRALLVSALAYVLFALQALFREFGAVELNVAGNLAEVMREPGWIVENLLITPHTAGLTDKLWPRHYELFADNLRRYVAGQPLLFVVDKQKGY